jgi:hypothetical protein
LFLEVILPETEAHNIIEVIALPAAELLKGGHSSVDRSRHPIGHINTMDKIMPVAEAVFMGAVDSVENFAINIRDKLPKWGQNQDPFPCMDGKVTQFQGTFLRHHTPVYGLELSHHHTAAPLCCMFSRVCCTGRQATLHSPTCGSSLTTFSLFVVVRKAFT